MISLGQAVLLDLIDVEDRERPVSDAHAQLLAASFEEIGMHSAVVLRAKDDGRFSLVIGGHRLQAARILEWTEIPAFVVA